MENSFIIKSEAILGDEPIDEAYSLLQNGILVETSKGLVCMSLNDALSSNLNLSEEDLKNVATKLILQQNVPKIKEKVYLKTSNLNFDSDGFSSECSDASLASGSSTSIQSGFLKFTSLANTPKIIPQKPELVKETQDVVVVNEIAKAIAIPPFEASSGVSDSDTNTKSSQLVSHQGAASVSSVSQSGELHKLPKKRGGWPKGRKRKPELLNLPPKAPATGYNLFLNEQRKLFKDSKLVFHEITKLIGNKWSNLSLEEKRPYLEKAEEDKRRYREELKQYRQSDAYRAYLAKKRKNRLQNNILSESDMDATDEIDDEDNEELYCRTCDQWFHNLHNKREHLQGKQHTQTIAGEIKRELDVSNVTPVQGISWDKLNLAASLIKDRSKHCNLKSVSDCMANLLLSVSSREQEINVIKSKLQDSISTSNSLTTQLNTLRQRCVMLKQNLSLLKESERYMEGKVTQLWQVPSWFIITKMDPDMSEEDNASVN